MALTPTLGSLEALYRKLERELYRAFHHRNRIHKADHFFNFCVTAHSLRDYYLERVGKSKPADRQPFEQQWSLEPLLVAVAEIANSAKHFTLRDRRTHAPRTPTTKRVGLKTAQFVDLYVNAEGEVKAVRVQAPDVAVTVASGASYDLYTFMSGVLQYWRMFLSNNGIKVRRQSIGSLRGSVT
jgi:hypothetical protein